MAGFPNRCQHLKINGTQCGSPALRRNRFCFFHKRFQDERIKLAADRARRGAATFTLPVLEDANSIQIALMQVMRLLVSQQIEHKTASLLLYALQTASSNLRMTDFNPFRHRVILDPRDAPCTPLDSNLWDDDDFEEELTEEEKRALALEEEQRKREEKAANMRWAAKEADRLAELGRRQQAREDAQEARLEAITKAAAAARAKELDQLDAAQKAREEARRARFANPAAAQNPAPNNPPSSPEIRAEKKPAASLRPEEIRAQIADMVKKELVPALAGKFPPATERLKPRGTAADAPKSSSTK